MIKTILTESGFVENKTFKETRFLRPPKSTYCIYMDSYERRGADSLNLIKDHSYTIELYSYTADAEAEKNIENILDKYGIQYEKHERFWIDSEQLYQVIYNFNFIEK